MDSEISSKYNSKSERLEGIADMEFFDFGVYEKLIKKDELKRKRQATTK